MKDEDKECTLFYVLRMTLSMIQWVSKSVDNDMALYFFVFLSTGVCVHLSRQNYNLSYIFHILFLYIRVLVK